MSIKLMSAIFETEMFDLEYLKDGEKRKAKASTAKLVLLALADHSNDYGESSYPGYSKLEIKTCLSRQGIADTLDALKYNGIITVDDKPSRLGTNNYTINIRSFPPMFEEKDSIPAVVKSLDYVKQLDSSRSSYLTQTSQATGLKPSINHPINQENTAEIFNALAEMTGGGLNSTTPQMVDKWLETHSTDRILQAIGIAREKKVRSMKYVDEILITWEAKGYPKSREERVLERRTEKPVAPVQKSRPMPDFDADGRVIVP